MSDTAPDHDVSDRRGGTRWSIVLIVVAAVVTLLATMSTWVERQALDTDAWVDATDELLADDEVREALATYLVDELYASVDVEGEISELLPEDFERLGPIVAATLREPATGAVDRVLATEAVQGAWSDANRTAHETLIAVIEDDTGELLSTSGGVVTIDLGELVRAVGERIGLGEDLLDRLPEDAGVVVLFESDELGVVQDAVAAVKLLTAFLFILVFALYAAGVYLASDRRIALRQAGVSLIVVAVIVLLARVLGVEILVDSLNQADDEEPARSILEIGSTLLRQIAITELLVGLAVVGFAYLRGPASFARGARTALAPALAHGWASAVIGGLIVFVLLRWLAPTGPIAGWALALAIAALCIAGVAWIQRLAVAENPEMTFARLGELATARFRPERTASPEDQEPVTPAADQD